MDYWREIERGRPAAQLMRGLGKTSVELAEIQLYGVLGAELLIRDLAFFEVILSSSMKTREQIS